MPQPRPKLDYSDRIIYAIGGFLYPKILHTPMSRDIEIPGWLKSRHIPNYQERKMTGGRTYGVY